MATEAIGVMRGSPNHELTIAAGGQTQLRYQRTWLILSDDPTNDDERTVRDTAGVPKLNEFWAGETNTSTRAISKKISVREDEVQTGLWYYTVDFDSQIDAGSGSPDGSGSSPPSSSQDLIDLSSDTRIGYQTIRKRQPRDVFGKPYATTAGEPYPPGDMEVSRSITTVTHSRWESHSGPLSLVYNSINFNDRLNSAPFLGFPNYSVHLAGYEADDRQVFGVILWRVTYVFRINPVWPYWLDAKWDYGSYYFTGSVGNVTGTQRFVDKTFRPTMGWLDGAGFPGTAASAAPRLFYPHFLANFNVLNL